MVSMQRVWKCSYLNTSTKIHLYQALVMSVLLYSAETWTLLSADVKRLDAFHMKCQRQILDIQWWQHISNAHVLQRSGLPLNSDILLHRRQSLFGHIARLDPSVPANAALQLMVNSHEGKKPSTTWMRPSGRPRRTWLNHIQDADARPLSTIWRSEVARGHGGAQRSVRTSRWWWWWWWWGMSRLSLAGCHYVGDSTCVYKTPWPSV